MKPGFPGKTREMSTMTRGRGTRGDAEPALRGRFRSNRRDLAPSLRDPQRCGGVRTGRADAPLDATAAAGDAASQPVPSRGGLDVEAATEGNRSAGMAIYGPLHNPDYLRFYHYE